MISQSLLTRKPKADYAKLFASILTRDKNNHAHLVAVPGSEAKMYKCILRRFQSKIVDKHNKEVWLWTISSECFLDTGLIGLIACQGNSGKGEKGTICYHSRAAIDKAIEDCGYRASWCQTYENAVRVSHTFAGKVYRVLSHQNGQEAFLAVKKVKP